MKTLRRRVTGPLILIVLILVIMAPQIQPVVGANISTVTRVGDSLIQGVAETGVPYLDSDDGYSYVVRGAGTGSIPQQLTTTPSSYAIRAGSLVGTDSLSNMSSSDNIYWNVRSAGGSGYYYPGSYTLIGNTTLKSGSINNLNSNDSQYMSFQSYPTNEGQYGLKFNSTYYMDAGNGPSLNLTGSFTIEFRVKWNAAPPQGHISDFVGKWDDGNGFQVYYDYSSGSFCIDAGLARNYQLKGYGSNWCPFTLGTWYHIVFINDNGRFLFYVNGINKGNITDTVNPGSTSEHLWIGGSTPASQNYILNYTTLDEVAIWNVVRPEWKGKASFTVPTEPYIGNEANLVGLWHFDEGTGSTAHDSTSNHNDAIAKKRIGGATTTPIWVEGYKFGGYVKVEFSGSTNLFSWNRLIWTTDLNCNTSSVTITIQVYNYTLGAYSTSGNGYLKYNSSSTPNTDETKTQTITVNPQQFRDPSTGAWKMKITGWKATTLSFLLRCDLVQYYSFSPGIEVELASILSDSLIRTGVSKLNVTVEAKYNVTSIVQNIYLFNYTKGAYQFGDTFTVGSADVTRHINITSRALDYINSTNSEMKIKINSTSTGNYLMSIDLVRWDLKYYEPTWAIQWGVDYWTNIPKLQITKLSVKLKSCLNETANLAYLSIYNYSSSSWTRAIQNVNHTSMQTQWYNTTTSSIINGFIRSDGYLNITMYVFTMNWTDVKSSTDHLTAYIESLTPDTVPPSSITDLAAISSTSNSITLRWTAPGDDGNIGSAKGYWVKYSTIGPINASSWGSATNYTQAQLWIPAPGGNIETRVVSGLTNGTTYWFAIKAYDEVPNYSGVSNSPSASTTDITPPAQITDLSAKSPTGTTITLTWKAVGDDGSVGTATGYVVKYSTSGAITDANWSSATIYTQSWIPLIAGSNETHTITGLNSGTKYWFAIEAFDETPNYGGVSNSPTASTIDIIPPSAITDLRLSNATADSITLTWTAPGDDGNIGTATGYIVKYSTTGSITSSNWDSATTYTQSWVPATNGSGETHVVTGLQSDTQYWFSVRALDETPNEGEVSNSPSMSTRDIIPPAGIVDLVVKNPTIDSVTLTWTAPGDDGNTGAATGYELRYSTFGPINDSNWDSAIVYVQSLIPLQGGSNETYTIYDLNSSTTYWFAVKAYDDYSNYGIVSNSAQGTTSTPQTGSTGSLSSLLIVIIPISLIVVASVGVVGLKVMSRSRQLGPKSPFRRRNNRPENLARPKLREYAGESGVVPQPKKKAKFEEESGAG